MWCIYIYTYIYNRILFSQNRGYPAVCNDMEGPWAHYAKWDTSDRERQVLYDITYV